MEHFWSSLQGIKQAVIFEIIGDATSADCFPVICHSEDKAHIANQLITMFPNSSLNPEAANDDFLAGYKGSSLQIQGLDYVGLTRHYSYPLRTLTSFDKTDP